MTSLFLQFLETYNWNIQEVGSGRCSTKSAN